MTFMDDFECERIFDKSVSAASVHATCFLSKPFGLGLGERGHFIALGVQTSMLKAMEVYALAVNHQV